MKALSTFVLLGITTVTSSAYWGYEEKVPNGVVHSCNTCHYSGAFREDFHAAGDPFRVTNPDDGED